MALIKACSWGGEAALQEAQKKTDGKSEGNEQVKWVLIRIRVLRKEHQMFAPQRDLL